MKHNNQIPISKLPAILQKDYQFVDLRDPFEFQKVHFKNFINIPLDEFDLSTYYFSRKEPLILLCYSGQSSKKLADQLCQAGYKAYSIEGGMYSILHQNQNENF